MTTYRVTGPDCAVICAIKNIYTTNTQTHMRKKKEKKLRGNFSLNNRKRKNNKKSRTNPPRPTEKDKKPTYVFVCLFFNGAHLRAPRVRLKAKEAASRNPAVTQTRLSSHSDSGCESPRTYDMTVGIRSLAPVATRK